MSDAPSSSDPLVAFLRDTGAACPMCRYNLKGVESSRCPECGYELRLAVARPATGFGWWLAGLFGLGCTAWLIWTILNPSIPKVAEAVNNPNLSALVRGGFVASSELPNWPVILWLSAALLACLALMGLIIGARRRLVTWPMKWQIICGSASLLSPLLTLILIAALT